MVLLPDVALALLLHFVAKAVAAGGHAAAGRVVAEPSGILKSVELS